MIKRVDRYLVKELIGPFFFGIAAFTSILAGSTVLFALIGDVIRYQIPILEFIQLFFYKLPYVVVLSFPMSTLLATILTFGRLSSDGELLAFRAGGVGFNRLVAPILASGFVISLVTITFNELIVPRASASGEMLMRSFSERTQPTIKQNINFTEYTDGIPSRILNVQSLNRGTMNNVTVAEFEKGHLSRLIRAQSGTWLKDGGWRFNNGIMHNFPTDEIRRLTVVQFKEEVIDIALNPIDLSNRKKKIEEMNSLELKKSIELQKKLGQDPINDQMNFHLKFAVPFACLIFSVLGASVGLRPHRSSSTIGLGISIVVILVYYILLSFGMGLGLSHTLPPILAAWTPNILVGGFGIYLLNRLSAQ
ncbi:YjgP/YjgQ family permease [bacterium]|nr:YjgP/YjgQ family permease [bacterium]